MNKTSKRFLGISCLVLALTATSFSQNIMVVNRRHVDIENMQEFNNRVRTYWRELARKEIADDRKAGWAVYQRIGGFDLHKDHNVVIVNFYTPEQFAKTGRRSYRNDTMKELFKDVKEEDIQISSISTRHDLLYYRNHAYYEVGKANIIRVNFSKSEKRGYFQMEPEIWGPFIDKQMKAGKTKVVSWGFSSLIIPRGADNQHDAVSVDGFSSLADALSGSNFDDDVEMPENLNELMDAHYKAQVHLYRLVASSDDEDEG